MEKEIGTNAFKIRQKLVSQKYISGTGKIKKYKKTKTTFCINLNRQERSRKIGKQISYSISYSEEINGQAHLRKSNG